MSKPSRIPLALALLFAVNLLNFYDRNILSVVNEPLRKQYGFTDTQLGWLGTAFILLYAVIGVPLGRLADRWNRKKLLSLGLLLWSGLAALSGAAIGFWSLFLTRLCMGVGEAACAPTASSLIGDYYPASRRSWALSIFMLGLPLGIMLSSFVSGAVAQAWGWRAAFFIAGVPGLLVALFILFLLEEPARGAAESAPIGARCRPGSPYLRVLNIPTMWWIIASGAIHNFNMYALSSFLPAFLMRTHGLSLRQAGFAAGLLLGCAGGAGLYLGGHLADRFSRARANGRLWLGSACMLAVVPLELIALREPDRHPYAFLLWMVPACLLLYVYYSTVYAAIQDIVEPSLRGTAMAIYFFAMYTLGGSAGPVLTGRLSDSLARRAAAGSAVTEPLKALGLHQAMYVIPALGLLVALTLYAASRTVARDRLRLEAWMAETASQTASR